VSLGALFIVILAASLGQGVLQYAGAKVRDQIRWQPVRFVDAVGGAALSAVAVLLVAWALGVAISGSRISGLSNAVRDSAVLAKVNRVMPAGASGVLDRFNTVVGTSFFPRYLEPFAPERIVRVGPGPQRLRKDPDVVRAGESVFKIHGTSSCGRGIEGSGFLYAPGYVMTNAHVVAGVDRPTVEVREDGDTHEVAGKVVLYDPQEDIAVIEVDSGDAAPLDLALTGKPRDAVAVLGYPQDGPYDVEPGRIRAEQRLRSPDIYGNGSVIRNVYSLRGLIRPGNSGGPIVDSNGDVVGVVFAASVTDRDTGYALTAEQVRQLASAAVGRTARVSTGGCA
jgi:S1-C subfamily serine protease